MILSFAHVPTSSAPHFHFAPASDTAAAVVSAAPAGTVAAVAASGVLTAVAAVFSYPGNAIATTYSLLGFWFSAVLEPSLPLLLLLALHLLLVLPLLLPLPTRPRL